MRVHFPTRAFDAVTFAELADYWWQAHGSKTRSQFEYLYPRVTKYFGEKRARDVTPDTVDAFLDHLATARKLSASSVNHHRTIVNGIFNFAVKRGRFDRNPVAAVKQRPEPPGRDRIVSPTEFRLLWDKAGDRTPLARARAVSAPDAGTARSDGEPHCDRTVSRDAGQEGPGDWHTYRHSAWEASVRKFQRTPSYWI